MKMPVVTLLLTAMLAGPLSAADPVQTDVPKTKRSAAEAWSADGLQKVSVKGLDVVYSRPGSSLAGYDKVLLRPVSVTFRRGWEKTPLAGTHMRIRPEEAQKIKDSLSTLVSEEVSKQLALGGYKISPAAGEDVLDVTMSITDLYITAPDVLSTTGVRIYAVSAGEMTLVAELRDSSSGETVMRIYDHAEARESSRPIRMSGLENEAEGRAAAKAWAIALRKQLDLANGRNTDAK